MQSQTSSCTTVETATTIITTTTAATPENLVGDDSDDVKPIMLLAGMGAAALSALLSILTAIMLCFNRHKGGVEKPIGMQEFARPPMPGYYPTY